jgi:formylglycine-generating enzyme required for sulfatase activity
MPAYKFDGSGNFQLWSVSDTGYDANNPYRNSLAKFYIPSTDEWYKAAYGSPNGTWYDYPTGSDSAPTAVASGTSENTAVYNKQSGPADITNAGGLSPYGTMAQGGNVWEWNETAYDGINDIVGESRELRGGTWEFPSIYLGINSVFNADPRAENGNFGFRVAMIPEPSSLSLLALGGVVVALRRRR